MLYTENTFKNYAYLKKLGNSYKLIKCNQVKRKGFESVDIVKNSDFITVRKGYENVRYPVDSYYANYSSLNDFHNSGNENDDNVKLANNISRARNKILEYVLCNEFDFFVTVTLSPDLFDRGNLCEFQKKLSVFIRDYNKRKSANIKYIFIPEMHKDGSWHMHGFIFGLPLNRLVKYNIKTEKKLPLYIVNKVKAGTDLYYFPDLEKKFGFNIFEKIRNKKASVLYMCKYLTKDISNNVRQYGMHLYYCSKGLKKAEIIKQGQFLDSSYKFDFENEFCSQTFYDELSEDELRDIKDMIGGDPITLDDRRRGYRIEKDGFISFSDSSTGEIFGEYDKDVLL